MLPMRFYVVNMQRLLHMPEYALLTHPIIVYYYLSPLSLQGGFLLGGQSNGPVIECDTKK